ncbi:MAG: hypothetical protein ORN98_04205 [Alphaproteobacteria bacterium]|nr:hypothetical protein [Alphaproteobacteria bacterium]
MLFPLLGRPPRIFVWRGLEPCSIKLNGESIITGYLETITETIDGHKHTIEISGRERQRAAAISLEESTLPSDFCR